MLGVKVADKDPKGMVAEPAVTDMMRSMSTALQLAWTWGSFIWALAFSFIRFSFCGYLHLSYFRQPDEEVLAFHLPTEGITQI